MAHLAVNDADFLDNMNMKTLMAYRDYVSLIPHVISCGRCQAFSRRDIELNPARFLDNSWVNVSELREFMSKEGMQQAVIKPEPVFLSSNLEATYTTGTEVFYPSAKPANFVMPLASIPQHAATPTFPGPPPPIIMPAEPFQSSYESEIYDLLPNDSTTTAPSSDNQFLSELSDLFDPSLGTNIHNFSSPNNNPVFDSLGDTAWNPQFYLPEERVAQGPDESGYNVLPPTDPFQDLTTLPQQSVIDVPLSLAAAKLPQISTRPISTKRARDLPDETLILPENKRKRERKRSRREIEGELGWAEVADDVIHMNVVRGGR